MPKFDTPDVKAAVSSKESHKVYVDIPREDLFELMHPPIIHNGVRYEPGRHFVEPDLAAEITRLVVLFDRTQRRLSRPKMDKVALDAVNRNGNRISGGSYFDPSSTELN